MSNWKSLERKVAKSLSGKRNSRGNDFGLFLPDVEHPLLSIECKYRDTLQDIEEELLVCIVYCTFQTLKIRAIKDRIKRQ